MRLFLLVFTSLVASSGLAMTKGQYLGRQMIVNLSSMSRDGSVDGSAQTLFESMDRPIQNSFLGKGKSLEAPKNILNFICAQKYHTDYQCSIYIHQSSFGRIAPGKAYFEAQGEQAAALFSQFYSKAGRVSYRDENDLFAVEATPDRFIIKFDENGL